MVQKTRFNIISVFPGIHCSPYRYSIIGRYIKEKKIVIKKYNLLKINGNKRIDDKVYGGGKGMIIKASAVDNAMLKIREKGLILNMSANGLKLDTKLIKQIAINNVFTLICGRYEGVDARIKVKYDMIDLCVSDVVFFDGDFPAMCAINAIIRYKLFDSNAVENDSFENGHLEHDQYTRPYEWEGIKVPDVLTSGNHKEIKKYKEKESSLKKINNRPDLCFKDKND